MPKHFPKPVISKKPTSRKASKNTSKKKDLVMLNSSGKETIIEHKPNIPFRAPSSDKAKVPDRARSPSSDRARVKAPFKAPDRAPAADRAPSDRIVDFAQLYKEKQLKEKKELESVSNIEEKSELNSEFEYDKGSDVSNPSDFQKGLLLGMELVSKPKKMAAKISRDTFGQNYMLLGNDNDKKGYLEEQLKKLTKNDIKHDTKQEGKGSRSRVAQTGGGSQIGSGSKTPPVLQSQDDLQKAKYRKRLEELEDIIQNGGGCESEAGTGIEPSLQEFKREKQQLLKYL
jgi:hypothetical protein